MTLKQKIFQALFIIAFLSYLLFMPTRAVALEMGRTDNSSRLNINTPPTANTVFLSPPQEFKIAKLDHLDEGKIALVLSWLPMLGATSYKIYTVSDNQFTPVGEVNTPTASLTFTNTLAFFNLTVSAVNSSGESPKAQTLAIKWNKPLPQSPTNFKLEKTEDQDNKKQATFTWDTVAGADKYYVYLTYPQKEKIGEITINQAVLTYIIPGINLKLGITAVNATGESELSNLVNIQRELEKPTSLPPIPLNFRLDKKEVLKEEYKIRLDFAWDRIAAAAKYDFYLLNGVIPQKIGEVYINTATLFVPEDYYTFTTIIKAVNQLGESDFSKRLTVNGKEWVLPTSPQAVGGDQEKLQSPQATPFSTAAEDEELKKIKQDIEAQLAEFSLQEKPVQENNSDILLTQSAIVLSPKAVATASANPIPNLLLEKPKVNLLTKISSTIKSWLAVFLRFFKK